jgi:hypothetical protein
MLERLDAIQERETRMSGFRRIFVFIVGLVVLAAGCASLPPAKHMTSVADVAGKWAGTGWGPRGSGPVTMTINPDGTYTGVVPSGTFSGKITLTGGKLRSLGDQSKAPGTFTLYEGDGRRVLRHANDDGQTGSELTPAR